MEWWLVAVWVLFFNRVVSFNRVLGVAVVSHRYIIGVGGLAVGVTTERWS